MRPATSSSLASSQKHKPTEKLRPDQLRNDLYNFPAPLILPDDDLALDPEYPAQSFQEWVDEEERNAVTARRRTVYVLGPPGVDGDDGSLSLDVDGWTRPRPRTTDGKLDSDIAFPETKDVVEYLSAFYHGLPVKQLDLPNWKFTAWKEPSATQSKRAAKAKRQKTQPIGLATCTECIRIRTRPCPDGLYTTQLNLNDLLDAVISILPKDAYALCMLVHHDLFEDDDDTFVCGRAYGGSRVAVVSTARYHPGLDGVAGIERGHAWPAAHCADYIAGVCQGVEKVGKKRKKSTPVPKSQSQSCEDGDRPLEAALAAYTTITATEQEAMNETPLWLWRISRTVSHELGHCFGIDHCVYYACIMQGSASLAEDTRQPPYLCPVDLAKVLAATGASVVERDKALLEFCEREEWRDEPGVKAFAAWLRASLGLQDLGAAGGADGGVDGQEGVAVAKGNENKKDGSGSGLITESWQRLWDDFDE
jgi:archaemetzincin